MHPTSCASTRRHTGSSRTTRCIRRFARCSAAGTAVTLIRQRDFVVDPVPAGGTAPLPPATAIIAAFTDDDAAPRSDWITLRKLLPQEWVRFGWYFLVSRRDPAGLREWIRLRRLGRAEKFGRQPERLSQ